MMSYIKKNKENFWTYETHPSFSFDGLWNCWLVIRSEKFYQAIPYSSAKRIIIKARIMLKANIVKTQKNTEIQKFLELF